MPNNPPAINRQYAGKFKATVGAPPAVKRVQASINKAADKYKWGSKGPK